MARTSGFRAGLTVSEISPSTIASTASDSTNRDGSTSPYRQRTNQKKNVTRQLVKQAVNCIIQQRDAGLRFHWARKCERPAHSQNAGMSGPIGNCEGLRFAGFLPVGRQADRRNVVWRTVAFLLITAPAAAVWNDWVNVWFGSAGNTL